jgi:hypothetical protein
VTGFSADLSGIAAAEKALRAAADDLSVDLTPAGDVGPGRLGVVVGALLTGAESDLARARAAVTALAESAGQVRNTYTELDTDAANRFDRGSW